MSAVRSTPPAPGAAPTSTPVRAVSYAVLALLGIAVAAAGSLVQDGWFPFGLLLALAGCVGLFYGGTVLTGTRAGAWVPSGAWLFTVLALTMSRPEGDAVFPATIGFYLFLLLGAMSGVMCATLPRLPGDGGTPGRLGG
ncbi:hypothetical protein AQ490_09920 [Wenjunlia vitaminophila]|uniref:Integral membrane protein n=1 Tax=Wenjunlia vitaminophila TaxID=76728 RepID=A0A0T6LLX4_WENVI|nr:hypothetical protein AQ490_09920 [Wenjunlia vitaminophila]